MHVCVWFVPERGKMPHAPPKWVPKRAIFDYFFANELMFSLTTQSFTFLHKFLQNWSRNGPFSGTFSPMNAVWRRQFDIDENETNCVNYKYRLVDAPGVSNSCID